jgi:hypothetical protein
MQELMCDAFKLNAKLISFLLWSVWLSLIKKHFWSEKSLLNIHVEILDILLPLYIYITCFDYKAIYDKVVEKNKGFNRVYMMIENWLDINLNH